jgi:hypothetical protein
MKSNEIIPKNKTMKIDFDEKRGIHGVIPQGSIHDCFFHQ